MVRAPARAPLISFNDCSFLDRPYCPITVEFRLRVGARMSVMEKQYKGHVLRVTMDSNAFPWKPVCRILDGVSQEFIKQLDWPLGYDTSDQAEKVGLLISKKWIDAGKPKPISLDS
jgi:hypothetical protein